MSLTAWLALPSPTRLPLVLPKPSPSMSAAAWGPWVSGRNWATAVRSFAVFSLWNSVSLDKQTSAGNGAGFSRPHKATWDHLTFPGYSAWLPGVS